MSLTLTPCRHHVPVLHQYSPVVPLRALPKEGEKSGNDKNTFDNILYPRMELFIIIIGIFNKLTKIKKKIEANRSTLRGFDFCLQRVGQSKI